MSMTSNILGTNLSIMEDLKKIEKWIYLCILLLITNILIDFYS